jgi:hypothetical protein
LSVPLEYLSSDAVRILCDPLLRRQMLYPTELRARVVLILAALVPSLRNCELNFRVREKCWPRVAVANKKKKRAARGASTAANVAFVSAVGGSGPPVMQYDKNLSPVLGNIHHLRMSYMRLNQPQAEFTVPC